MRQMLNIILVAGCTALPAQAALINSSILTIETGSFYTLNSVDDSPPDTFVSGNYLLGHNGLILGTTQEALGSHSGGVDGSEMPGIDQAWEFGANTGMHETKTPTNVLSASGNTATVDFSGWGVDWNGQEEAETYGAWFAGTSNGVANVTCGLDCENGDFYTLIYSAASCGGVPNCFDPIEYYLELHGVVSAVPVPAAVWLFGSGLIGLLGMARRKQAV